MAARNVRTQVQRSVPPSSSATCRPSAVRQLSFQETNRFFGRYGPVVGFGTHYTAVCSCSFLHTGEGVTAGADPGGGVMGGS